MAFSDPQTVTINAIANTLPRTGFGPSDGNFTKDDGNIKLTISHQFNKRVRHVARIDQSIIASDPLVTGNNLKLSQSIYLVIDTPVTGLTPAQVKQLGDGFLTWLTASSGANLAKVIGGEV